jgi:phosphoribosylformylglycinamidine synthase subunit PurQ / glutaminase
MRIGIVQFPGSNCERETILAVQRAGMTPVEFLWNEPAEKLEAFDGYIIVGGFSYEDRSRSGAIAALDPIMNIIRAQSEKGKPILGICNGAQILVETGLVPGIAKQQVGMALTENKRLSDDGQILGTGFYNAWIHMRLTDDFQYNAFTRYLSPKDILTVPVAHAEGRFVIPEGLLMEMQVQGLGLFQYCDAYGNIINKFPINPNGSVTNIAAVSNKNGNVLAMMPHPERTTVGDPIFQSMRDYIASGNSEKVAPLSYQPRVDAIAPFETSSATRELIVELMITDNHAMSVENALTRKDIPVSVRRQVHWEIECDTATAYEEIITSGVLFNDRKEILLHPADVKKEKQVSFLVRPKEDMLGQQKKQMLEHHFGIKGIRTIRHGILWSVAGPNAEALSDHVINSHILYNPYAHDCYYYQ